MRILLIGDQSIQNDAVKSVLNAEIGTEVWQITHAQTQDGHTMTKRCHISLVDLTSLPENPIQYVQDISEKKLSKYLIVLYKGPHDGLNEALIGAGADFCFSFDSEPEELTQVILQFNRS